MWRAPSKGMERPVDAEAEKIKARKERKRGKQPFRALVRSEGILAAAKLILNAATLPPADPADEDCPMCLKRQRRNEERAQRFARSPRQGAFGLARAIMGKHRPPALDPKDTRSELNFDRQGR